MHQWVLNKLYRPVLFFFLLPIFYLALGSTFALQYNTFNWLSLTLLYAFVLINQMLENILLRIPKNDFNLSQPFLLILELLNLLLLLYFGWSHSWLAALILFLYTIFIQLQFLFSYYNLEVVAMFVASFFKVILLNGFSFYVQANFIHIRFLPFYIALFLPFYLFEISRGDTTLDRKWLDGLLALSIVVGIANLWGIAAQWSFLMVLVVPSAWLVRVEFSRKTTAIYAFFYSFLYIITLLLT